MNGLGGGLLDLTWTVGSQTERYTYTGLNFNGYIGFYVNRAVGAENEPTWWLTVEDFALSGN